MKTNLSNTKALFIALICIFSFNNVWGQTSITDEAGLRAIADNLSGDYVLANDIVLTSDWEPIGEFTGTLDGQGYTISGLRYIQGDDDVDGAALFGIARGATIQRIGIVGAYICATKRVGAIAGYSYGSTITQCWVDQSSYIEGNDHVGGIVGGARANDDVKTTVSDCYAAADVYSSGHQAGGIVGTLVNAIVERCYFSGRATAVYSGTGGIYGIFDDSSDTSIVQDNVSLACGVYNSNVGNGWCYARCVGGSAKTATTLQNNYTDYYASYTGKSLSESAVTTSDDAGSEEGKTLYSNEVLTKDFYTTTLGWDFDDVWTFPEGGEDKTYPILACQQNKVVTPCVYGLADGLSLTQNEDGTTVSDISFEKVRSTAAQKLSFEVTDGSDYIEIKVEEGISYLTFKEDVLEGTYTATLSVTPEAGEATGVEVHDDIEVFLIGGATAPISISSVDEFLAVGNYLALSYQLEKDIDMDGIEFEGFGSSSSPYSGTFDGNGYTISNLSITTNSGDSRGIFNNTDGATIKNLGILNFSRAEGSTSNNSQMGTLIGVAKNTTIDQCYVTGIVSGNDHVGGLTGQCNNVIITNTFVDVAVTSTGQIGGFTGTTVGDVTFENCYFNGSIYANVSWSWVWGGGFIGLVDVSDITQTITGCVSIGDVDAPQAGWFIGGNGTGSDGDPGSSSIIHFSNNVFNYDATVTSGGSRSWDYGNLCRTADGGSVTSAIEYYMVPDNEFLTQAPYNVASFDFDNIWTMNASINGGYPTLQNVVFKGDGYVDAIEQAAEQTYKVAAKDNIVVVAGISQDAQVAVYSVTGQLIATVEATNSVSIEVAAKGIYLVQIVENGTSTVAKVVVR